MFSFSKLILPIALFAPCINATVYLPKGITMQSVQTANIIIAWDIHNVPQSKMVLQKQVPSLAIYFPSYGPNYLILPHGMR